MEDESDASSISFVDIWLSNFDFESFNVSQALEAIFKKHQSKKKDAKVVFLVNSAEDIDKMFWIMEGLERWIVKRSELPEYILEDIPKEVQFTAGTAPFWPWNWITHINLMCRMQQNMHSILEKLYDLPNVERLAISHVNGELPLLRSSIGKLKKLKSFSMQYTYENSLPPVLRFCKDLEELDLSSNHFRHLPFWVTKLKKLEKLRRFENPLMYGAQPYECIERGVAGHTEVEVQNNNVNEKKKLKSPGSLFLLTATAAVVEFPHLFFVHGDNTTLEIPRTVCSDIVSVAPMIKFCDQCNQAFVSDEYPVLRKTFRNFKGYTNIPFEAVLCSDVCADELYRQWVIIADAENSDDDNEDNPAVDNSNPLEIVHLPGYYRPEYSCREKISNFLRRALCCCC